MQDLEEVKMGVVAHFAAFLAMLSPDCRSQYANVVKELQEETNWRIRKHCAAQMSEFASLFSGEQLADSIIPVCLKLCQDPVISVRSAAFEGMAKFLAALEMTNASLFTSLFGELTKLKEGSFHDRKTLVQICGGYLSIPNTLNRQIFITMLEGFVTGKLRVGCGFFQNSNLPFFFFKDKTANVRMKVADALRVNLPDSPGLKVLTEDDDYDVRFAATNEFVPFVERKKKDATKKARKQQGSGMAIPSSLGPPALAHPRSREFVDSSNLIEQLKEGSDDSFGNKN
jgi:hypothetical protein